MKFTRRSSFAALAALAIGPVLVPTIARAQGATDAPPGGVPSTTAPSNSEGTPAGGSGTIGRTTTGGNHHTRRRRRHRSTQSTNSPS